MGNRLLLADDSITIQKVVGIIFSNEDYELTIVDNGNAALEKAAETKPDVMLVDAIMPGKTGYEVCEAVRRDPSLKSTPILLLTGAFEPFDEDKARQSGADDFIAKPFESQHLIEKVKNLITLGKERAAAPPVVEAPAAFAQEPAAAPADLWAESPAAEPISFDTFALEEPAAAEAGGEFFFEEVGGEDVFATELVSPEEIEIASPSDDLWGAFELEEVQEKEEAAFGTVVEPGAGAPSAVEAEPEPFSFAEEEPAMPDASAFKAGFADENIPWQPVEEHTFELEEVTGAEAVSFADVEPAAAAAVAPQPVVSAASELEFEVSLEEPTAFAAPAAAAPETIFAPEEEFVPAPAAVSAAAAPSAVAPAGMSISEEQLTALVAKISKDIIEKIAWDVVPDLAEALIKEEIRKIKEG